MTTSPYLYITTIYSYWRTSPCLNKLYNIQLQYFRAKFFYTQYFTPWPWFLALNICMWPDETLYQIWTQSSNPRWSYWDFSVWPYDLEQVLISVALGACMIFTKFDFRQLICAWIIAFFDAGTLCQAVTLTLDRLTLKVRGTLSVTWSKSLRNLSEIEQSPAALLIILRIFAHVMSRCDLDLWLFDLEILQYFECYVL